MNADKIIHEALGLCWHIVSKDKKVFDDICGKFNIRYCVKCGQSWNNCINGSDPEYQRGPDYTDPVHYCALMDWMRENDRWHKFRGWFQLCIEDFLEFDRQEQITIIAKAIEAGVLP